MKTVDHSYIGSCDEVNHLVDRVEGTFIKYFANSNRREGMKLLTTKWKREQHRVTFFSGFFIGCSIALLIAIILLIKERKMMSKDEHTMYIENFFPLYSLYTSGGAVESTIPFIFSFKQGTELDHYDVFLISRGLAVRTLDTFLVHMHIKVDC